MTTHRLSATALAVTLLCAAPATAASFHNGEWDTPVGSLDFTSHLGGSDYGYTRGQWEGGSSGCRMAEMLKVSGDWYCTTYGSFFEKLAYWVKHYREQPEAPEETDTPITAPLDPEPETPSTPVVTPDQPDPVSPSPVPVPAAGWLLLAALGSVAAVRKAQ